MHLSAMESPIENCQEIDADEVHLLEVHLAGSVNHFFPKSSSVLCLTRLRHSSPPQAPEAINWHHTLGKKEVWVLQVLSHLQQHLSQPLVTVPPVLIASPHPRVSFHAGAQVLLTSHHLQQCLILALYRLLMLLTWQIFCLHGSYLFTW